MFEQSHFYATIACKDVEKSRTFWEDTMGFRALGDVRADGSLRLEAPGNQVFCLYPSQFAGTAQHTVMGFEVDNFDSTLDNLRVNGIQFEDYDLPGLKTVNGVATMDGGSCAWFKDPDGNIIAVSTRVPVHA